MDGVHLSNKSNSDVLGIIFERQSMMNHLVQGATAFFSKIENFYVAHSELSYIQRSDFKRYTNLRTLFLSNNNIQRIPHDAFVDLVNLKFLSLAFNKIKSLPNSIFRTLTSLKGLYLNNNKMQEFSDLTLKFNMQLEEVWLHENELKTISSHLAMPSQHMKSIRLSGNVCINNDFNNITAKVFESMILEIATNCSSNCEEKVIEIAECNEEYFELERENENLKKEIQQLRKYLRSKLII